jgi:hypothetical protein
MVAYFRKKCIQVFKNQNALPVMLGDNLRTVYVTLAGIHFYTIHARGEKYFLAFLFLTSYIHTLIYTAACSV